MSLVSLVSAIPLEAAFDQKCKDGTIRALGETDSQDSLNSLSAAPAEDKDTVGKEILALTPPMDRRDIHSALDGKHGTETVDQALDSLIGAGVVRKTAHFRLTWERVADRGAEA